MKKSLIVILVLVVVGAGALYFLYIAPSSNESNSTQSATTETINTKIDVTVLDKLNEFSANGNFPITVNPASLRKSDPQKANDPFYN